MHRHQRYTRALLVMVAVLLVIAAAPVGAQPENPNSKGNPPFVELQILAINDFHGAIAPVPDQLWLDQPVGRADFFASHIREAEEGTRNSVVVSAGDLIGASPLISALFHDEPTIEAMNLIGLDIAGVGNHEFDEGPAELLRMQEGGCHPVDMCLDGDGFAGADFQYLAANVTVDATGETLFPPYVIENYQGVRVAYIGITLEGTPSIVTQAGVAGLTFHDEVETVNALIPELTTQGVEAIVVLLHEGGFSSGGPEGDDCEDGLTDPLRSIVEGFHPAVDLVIAGHVNDEFVCKIGNTWVTMADNNGRLYTDIDVRLNSRSGDMKVVAIDNVPTFQSEVDPAADLTALIDKYDALSEPLANMVIGTITADIPENYNAAGEAAVGDVIADAQLAATSSDTTGDAVVAFMNPGGIRTSDGFIFAGSPEGEGDGNVTYGEAFAVQPFGNSLVTMTLTGAQIDTLLEQQFDNPGVGETRILQVSAGFTYTWDASQPTGSKVDPSTIMIGGVPIVATDSYRVTVNSFLADGGDNFVVLREGTERLGGEIDLDAMVAYFEANSPVAPGPQNRITQVP
ncbi:MAG TPA: bifunctional metallophosphatase/5'-nucleotidase [Acidimicrobiia bacterium]|nr:bifunctional metallophosphatase/5'-nucleotidase [Acidimicrobiia bacterium]